MVDVDKLHKIDLLAASRLICNIGRCRFTVEYLVVVDVELYLLHNIDLLATPRIIFSSGRCVSASLFRSTCYTKDNI